ncbi:VOC family protein [Candidatus Rariloculus sp.]|uniref:VOC family protein n=1 Tax=Candidatus Rariloculus sp. TaxID=3101265 RepID=UPI003D136364
MKVNVIALAGAAALLALTCGVAAAAGVDYVHIAVPSPIEAVKWYTEHMECAPSVKQADAADCHGVEVEFGVAPTLGGTPGTGVNHIGFSFPDLEAKMSELEAVGVRGAGVRLQRFEDGSTFRDVPGLFKLGFIFDPWGTRIELAEDPDYLGFHHIHLSSADPAATLAWYQDVLGGVPAILKGRLNGLLFDDVWLLVSQHEEGVPAPTAGRTLDHLGFVVADIDTAAADMREQRVVFEEAPAVPDNGRSGARRAFLAGPDSVRVAVVETDWAGVVPVQTAATVTPEVREPYTVPRTPWGTPDLQGIWTGDAAHGIPLERPLDAAEISALTPEEAEARRERGTLSSIWGYEREWRDTTLGYAKDAPSTQVAMVIDPPEGRLPPMTPEGEALIAAAVNAERGLPAGPEDLSSWVRCITRGLPGMMMPGVYNNGLQIVQSPGFVAIQKEMIHETRVIPTAGQPHLGPNLTQWLGDSRGRWEGDTLVIEVTNFNGKASYRGSSENMTLIERYTRTGSDTLEYEFTVDDPTIWTAPWTAMFAFVRDDDQYELVEYACHEGNYGMTNILSGARANEREQAAQQ